MNYENECATRPVAGQRFAVVTGPLTATGAIEHTMSRLMGVVERCENLLSRVRAKNTALLGARPESAPLIGAGKNALDVPAVHGLMDLLTRVDSLVDALSDELSRYESDV